MNSVSEFCRGCTLLFCLVVGGLLFPAAGCTPQEGDIQTIEEESTSNLRQLAIVMGQYQAQHRGQRPPNEEALRKFIESQHMNPDDVLISNRDQQPVVIVYPGDQGKVKDPNIVAYEREGKGGKRIIVNQVGATRLVTEEEFRQIVPE